MTRDAAKRFDGARFEPVIIGFTCNWCSYRAADLAGTARMKYPPNIRLVRLMCSGRLDPAFVLEAFAHGADGVLVTGCWPGDCHYLEQNYYALRRFQMLKRTLEGLGLDVHRLRLVWASAAEGMRLASEFSTFVDEVRGLGPLHWGASAASPAGTRPASAAAIADRVEEAIAASITDAVAGAATTRPVTDAVTDEVTA
jgi:F420-non-reducing hydrogenase iron-sulfur subunit